MINITAKFKLEDNLVSMKFLTFRSEVVIKKKTKMNKLINSCGYAAIDPWFITGFTDAVRSGCFSLSILRNKERKVG